MDNSHGREIHYHLARALMHLNSIAGFLPFFEPSVDWEDYKVDPCRRPSFTSPRHIRELHTFVPLPAAPSIPSLSSFQLTWSSIQSPTYDPCLFVAGHVQFEWNHLFPPVEWECLPLVPQSTFLIVNLTSHPMKQNRAVPKPTNHGLKMFVQRKNTVPWAQHRPPRRPPLLRPYQSSATFLRGPSSDDSDGDIYRGHSPSNPRPTSPPSVNPSALAAGPPRPPPAEERPVPAFAKAGVTSTPAGNPVIPPRSSVNHHLRPWTDAEDHELVTFKSDTRARPSVSV
jgi:hypothetical protein